MSDPARLDAVLERFRRSTRGSPAFGLGPIRAALSGLGDPQDHIGPAIHITGTNGKGSTAAFLRAMAEAAGMTVHAFTSPHLMRVNERIRVAGRLVEDEPLSDALERIATLEKNLTYFEALTAAAYVLFAETPASLSIIEVGAGGSTDATNVMSRPTATVVTPISRDHEAMFGVTGIAAIARLKAGIFRPGSPAILAEQPPLALGVLLEEARKAGAPVLSAGRQWSAGWDGDAFVFSGSRLKVRSPWLSLPGRHQASNAGAACAAAEAWGEPRLTAEIMAAGLRAASWPARLQKLRLGPLTSDYRGAIWIDAAHNPGGARALAAAIMAERPKLGGVRVALIVAMQASKDHHAMLAELASVIDEVIACPLPDSGGQEGGPGAEPELVAASANALGAPSRTAVDFRHALELAREAGAHRIFVCGSLYLCGAVLAANGEQVD